MDIVTYQTWVEGCNHKFDFLSKVYLYCAVAGRFVIFAKLIFKIPKKYKTGRIVKNSWKTKTSRYDLQFGEDGLIKDIGQVFQNPNYSVQTRMISLSLRHGAHTSFLAEQLRRDPDSDMFSFSRAISRVLKKYIEDGTRVSSTLVEDCDIKKCELVYQDGCATCVTCGYAQCG